MATLRSVGALVDRDFRHSSQQSQTKSIEGTRRELFKVIRRSNCNEYVEHLAGDGPTIFEHACRLGYEGIVSKRVDLAYRGGQSRIWLKTKNKDHPAMQRVRQAFERERERRGSRE